LKIIIKNTKYLQGFFELVHIIMLLNDQKSLGDKLARKSFFNEAESFHFISKST